MDNEGNIIINGNDFQRGATESLFGGLNFSQNVDPHSEPGILKIEKTFEAIDYTTRADSGIYGFAYNPQHDQLFFIYEDEIYPGYHTINAYDTGSGGLSDIYRVEDDGGLGSGNNSYMKPIVWEGSVVAVYPDGYSSAGGFGSVNKVRFTGYGPVVGDGANLANDRANLGYSTHLQAYDYETDCHVFVGTDATLYVGSGNFVHSMTKPTAETEFDVTDPATYDINTNVLDLPNDKIINDIIEYADNMYIVASDYAGNNGALYPWDGTSSSFGVPVQMGTTGATDAIVSGQRIFVFDGYTGVIKQTNGTTVQTIVDTGKIFRNHKGEGSYRREKLTTSDSFGSRKAIKDDGVIFGMIPATGAEDKQDYYGYWFLKNGSVTYTKVIVPDQLIEQITAIAHVEDTTFIAGRFDDTSGDNNEGYFLLKTCNCYHTDYSSFIESSWYRPGIYDNKKAYQEIEIRLARKLREDEGVKVFYRKDQGDAFTEVVEFSYDLHGAVSSINLPAKIADAELIQFQVALKGNTTTPKLQEVMVK